MGRPRQTRWTEETVYATIKTFVLAEGRLPSVRDYEAQTHGLPSNSGIAYRYCKRFKERLAKDGISYAPYARRPARLRAVMRTHFAMQRSPSPLRAYGEQRYGTANHRGMESPFSHG